MTTNSVLEFANSEDGAVTVDWVVLTAAIVGLGLAVLAVVSGGVEDLSRDIDDELVEMEVAAAFGTSAGWSAGSLLSWEEGFWNDAVDMWAAGGDVDNSLFGANEALTHAENGVHDPAHQLDAAAAHITALGQMGEDTTELQQRYDAAYADFVANNT
jgi:hypothetical protein